METWLGPIFFASAVGILPFSNSMPTYIVICPFTVCHSYFIKYPDQKGFEVQALKHNAGQGWPICSRCDPNGIDSLCIWHMVDQRGRRNTTTDKAGNRKQQIRQGKEIGVTLREGSLFTSVV